MGSIESFFRFGLAALALVGCASKPQAQPNPTPNRPSCPGYLKPLNLNEPPPVGTPKSPAQLSLAVDPFGYFGIMLLNSEGQQDAEPFPENNGDYELLHITNASGSITSVVVYRYENYLCFANSVSIAPKNQAPSPDTHIPSEDNS